MARNQSSLGRIKNMTVKYCVSTIISRLGQRTNLTRLRIYRLAVRYVFERFTKCYLCQNYTKIISTLPDSQSKK